MSEEHHQATTATAEAIEADFGGRWGVWLSDTGRWWAARTGPLTSAQLNAGCVPFLEADNPDELTELIRQQDRLNPGDRDTAPGSFRQMRLGIRTMPDEPAPIDQPKHALPSLTTYELRDYRQQLESAIAFLDKKDPVPPARDQLQGALDKVLAEQEHQPPSTRTSRDRPQCRLGTRAYSAPDPPRSSWQRMHHSAHGHHQPLEQRNRPAQPRARAPDL